MVSILTHCLKYGGHYKAKQDIYRLIKYLEQPDNQNKRIQLIGFGDVKQRETLALAFSKLRALAVKTALHKHGVEAEPVEGFGAYLPVASNEGEGKYKNQRVEVWLFDDAGEIHHDNTNRNGLSVSADFKYSE